MASSSKVVAAAASGSTSAAAGFPAPPEDKRLFYVERVLDRKFIGDQKWWLVKWVGYPSAYNSWESLSNLEPGHENVALINGDVVRWDNKMARRGIKKLELRVRIRRKKEMYRVILNEVDDDKFVKPLPFKKRKYVLNANGDAGGTSTQAAERPRLAAAKPSLATKDASASAGTSDSGIGLANGGADDKKVPVPVNEDDIAAARFLARCLINGGPEEENGPELLTFHAAEEF